MNVQSLIDYLEGKLSVFILYEEIRIDMDEFYVLGRTKSISPMYTQNYANYKLCDNVLARLLKDSAFIGPRIYFVEYIMQYLDFFDEWDFDAKTKEVIENLSDAYIGYMATDHNIENSIKYLEGSSTKLVLSSNVRHTKR